MRLQRGIFLSGSRQTRVLALLCDVRRTKECGCGRELYIVGGKADAKNSFACFDGVRRFEIVISAHTTQSLLLYSDPFFEYLINYLQYPW
jgi:hypothetical protein